MRRIVSALQHLGLSSKSVGFFSNDRDEICCEVENMAADKTADEVMRRQTCPHGSFVIALLSTIRHPALRVGTLP